MIDFILIQHRLISDREELGEDEKAVQAKIVGAHLLPRKSKENESGKGAMWKELGSRSRDLGLLQQAIYCYSQAIKVDKTDVEAIWDKASLLKETGRLRPVG
jgi:general transcription factor 3C polypeptide 3 (transcription factor C subunit 4)